MIRNLRETTRQNTEQDWLKTNLERFTRLLQGQRDLATVSDMVLSELAPLVCAQHGVFYALTDPGNGAEPCLEFQAGYGFQERKQLSRSFLIGEGLVGQCAFEKKRILLTDVPSDYIQISSGLGHSTPLNIIVLPILFEGAVRGVIELASFAPFSVTHQAFLDQLTGSIGLVLNTVDATAVTEQLLEHAQSQAQELQSRQEQLRQSNEDLADQAAVLAGKNSVIAGKYQEVEQAKRLVDEKATELSVSSRYKSEFIANMSHELRTPLNSLLVLAEQLEDNPHGNLTPEQVQYARVIRTSGGDLLKLLHDILDLAKVESQTVNLELVELSLTELRDSMAHTFQPIAERQGLAFSADVGEGAPATIVSDRHRLRQVLRNLLANACKFTDHGGITLRFDVGRRGWSLDNARLEQAESVLAISVRDSGIGIPKDLQTEMFEPFAQADGTTARQHGGTGLGLSISRSLVEQLGGEIALASEPGKGSTFTVYLPREHSPVADPAVAPAISPPVVSARSQPAPEPMLPATSDEPKRGTAVGRAFYKGSAAGTTVLVVDDDFRNVFAMTALLERGEAIVVSAGSGAEALITLDARRDIDIVLMDIMMPLMDGYEAIAAIRSRPHFADLPIIAVTGKVIGSERERCVAAGASGYIPKPVNTAELLDTLSHWFPATPRSVGVAVLDGA
jgi:signal transduction histidine kinase/ActR/RegA family two-component response regulator